MRVAIVNDAPTSLEALRRLVSSKHPHVVAWTAKNGEEAVRMAKADTPDVILMDLVMPGLSGAQATREIMRQSPCAILVVTATVAGNFCLVSEAMGYGAYDAVETPSLTGTGNSAQNLFDKLTRVDKINQRLKGTASTLNLPAVAPPKPSLPGNIFAAHGSHLPPIVAIGSSTGGPAALDLIFSKLPATFPGAILVAQHVGEEFTASMAQWLQDHSKLKIVVAKSGEIPKAGTVYIASTSDHMILGREGAIRYTRDPAEYPYRPSVDTLFESLVNAAVAPCLGVLLTGIGADGAKGLLRLRQAGWVTIAQDQASSVVYGMPQAAVKLGAAAHILPVSEISRNLEFFIQGSKRTGRI
jgi:two-component system, chemotaxis family, response regulator WspF